MKNTYTITTSMPMPTIYNSAAGNHRSTANLAPYLDTKKTDHWLTDLKYLIASPHALYGHIDAGQVIVVLDDEATARVFDTKWGADK